MDLTALEKTKNPLKWLVSSSKVDNLNLSADFYLFISELLQNT